MIISCIRPKKIGEKTSIGWISDAEGIIHKVEPGQPAIVMKEVTKEDYLNESSVIPWVNRVGKENANKYLTYRNRNYFYECSTD